MPQDVLNLDRSPTDPIDHDKQLVVFVKNILNIPFKIDAGDGLLFLHLVIGLRLFVFQFQEDGFLCLELTDIAVDVFTVDVITNFNSEYGAVFRAVDRRYVGEGHEGPFIEIFRFYFVGESFTHRPQRGRLGHNLNRRIHEKVVRLNVRHVAIRDFQLGGGKIEIGFGGDPEHTAG